jgi:methionyl-tRNA formyltransferase
VAAEPDIFVVAAFGLIFGRKTLQIPRLGSLNVHPSLLPKYRGAAPVVAALAHGEANTGVSLMLMEAGIDTGPVISMEQVEIAADDTTESLTARLALVAAAQTARDVPRWARGELAATPQAGAEASLTRPLTKQDGWIDWTQSAVALERHVRAMWPWPRAWTTANGARLQVHAAATADVARHGRAPGDVIPTRQRLIVATGDGALELLTLEPEGRRTMSASAYLNGLRRPLLRLGELGAPPPQPPLVVAVLPMDAE